TSIAFLLPQPATPQPYTLSLHDALPIYPAHAHDGGRHHEVQCHQHEHLNLLHVVGASCDEGGRAEGADLEGTQGVHLAVQFAAQDRKSTRLNSSHVKISYAVFCLKKKKH